MNWKFFYLLILFALSTILYAENMTEVKINITNAKLKNGLNLINFNESFILNISIRNLSQKKDLKYLKIKLSKSLTDYFEIYQIEPKPKSSSKWGPFNLAFKWKKEIILKPQERTHVKFFCRANKSLGQAFGSISVHGMAGAVTRFEPSKISFTDLVVIDPSNPSFYSAKSGFLGAFLNGFKKPFETMGLLDKTKKPDKKIFINKDYEDIWAKFNSKSKLTDLQKQKLWEKNYQDKWIKGSGYVVSVNKFFGQLSIQLNNNKKSYDSIIIISFDGYWEDDLVKISKGDKIKFEAILNDYNSILGLSLNNGIIK